jgi:hypothetical protein
MLKYFSDLASFAIDLRRSAGGWQYRPRRQAAEAPGDMHTQRPRDMVEEFRAGRPPRIAGADGNLVVQMDNADRAAPERASGKRLPVA